MAINKKLIHFDNFSTFNSMKLSANAENTKYTLGVYGMVQTGSPEILYQSICYIKDTKQQWTHGQLYEGSKPVLPLNETDPVFSASPAAKITEADITVWDGAADLVAGHDTDIAQLFNDIEGKQDTISDLATIRDGASKGATAVQPNDVSEFITIEDVAAVATSGNYNDLNNKPTIPAAVTESTVSGWGFTKNAGTITGVSVNGKSIATNGVANIPAASTGVYGVTKLSSATNSTSTTLAATASAVKAAYDLANSYKGTVTGVKINGSTHSPSNGVVDLGSVITSHQILKTINGQSIIGSGDITISGGSSGANVQAVDTGDVLDDVTVNYATKTYVDGLVGDINSVLESINGGASGGSSAGGSGAYSEVNHGTNDTTFTLTPNTFHVWDEVASLTLDLGSETSGVANEYLFQFNSGATATSLTLPDNIKWANELAIEANKIYQVSILKGLGSVLEWDKAPTLIENKVNVSISGTKYLVSLQYAATSDIVVKVRTVDGPISVNILSGEISKTARPLGPIVDSGAYIEGIAPISDNNYNYVW